MLGIVGFAGHIVAFALAPIARVWVERLDRRKLLVWTQAAGAVQSLTLAALTLAMLSPLGNNCARRVSGSDQCVRYASASIVPDTDGGRPQRFE